MISHFCKPTCRSHEIISCKSCDTTVSHVRSAQDTKNHDRGDRVFQWKCAVCNAITETLPEINNTANNEAFTQAVDRLSEKFELVNKIHLPKVYHEFEQLKTMAVHVTKQNEQILRKLNELEKRDQERLRVQRNYRKVCFKLCRSESIEGKEQIPILPTEKTVRFRLRPNRKSYLVNKMFNIFNRKFNRVKKRQQ